MGQKKLQYLTIQQFVFLAYLTLTTLMFFLAMSQGNDIMLPYSETII